MACQGPDGLKVICKLPDLVNVFVLLSQSVLDIEKSGVLKTQENKEAFHVLYKLTRKIADKLNKLSSALNRSRAHLVDMIKSKATEKERPLLLQKVTGVLQELRQEMGKLAPKLQDMKAGARDASNQRAVDHAINLIVNKEAQMEVDEGRAEGGVYRSSRIPNRDALLVRQTELDSSTTALSNIREFFKYFHTIAQVDTSLMKLEQDIGDFLTEILLLFQEEIVELKMLIRLCQSSITSTEKDKDRKMLAALNHVKKYMGADEDEDEDEADELDVVETECEPTVRTWKEITNELFETGKIIA